jgi:hypothetical protein
MSSSTKSGRMLRAMKSAELPSLATFTSCPSKAISLDSDSAASWLSSTTKMRRFVAGTGIGTSMPVLVSIAVPGWPIRHSAS